MKVLSVNHSNRNIHPYFGHWQREVINPQKCIINRNDTCFFREENFFPTLTKYLSEKFKDISKVNVYCYGCSDGSEPFTFAMRMLTMKDEKNPQKFFPIIAKDIDPIAIKKALSNEYKISKYEKDYINYFTYDQINRFFNFPHNNLNIEDDLQAYGKKELYNNVKFSVADIFEDYKNIKPKNSIILARNFWPYIEDTKKRTNFFKDLYKHLESNSYLIIGDFDQKGISFQFEEDFDFEIRKAGFKSTPLKYVYQK